MSLNQKKPPTKLSALDKRLNYFVYGLFFINVLLCITMAILAGFFEWKYVTDAWYLPVSPSYYLFIYFMCSYFVSIFDVDRLGRPLDCWVEDVLLLLRFAQLLDPTFSCGVIGNGQSPSSAIYGMGRPHEEGWRSHDCKDF